MHKNNYVPTIVERDARRATRICCGGSMRIKFYKKTAHKNYRKKLRMQMYDIARGVLDPEEWDDAAIGSCRCTGWDIC